MIKKEDQIMEDYIEGLQYNRHCSKIKLDKPTLKTLLLKGVKEECMEVINLMGGGDIPHANYDDIYKLCRRYCQGIDRNSKGV